MKCTCMKEYSYLMKWAANSCPYQEGFQFKLDFVALFV